MSVRSKEEKERQYRTWQSRRSIPAREEQGHKMRKNVSHYNPKFIAWNQLQTLREPKHVKER